MWLGALECLGFFKLWRTTVWCLVRALLPLLLLLDWNTYARRSTPTVLLYCCGVGVEVEVAVRRCSIVLLKGLYHSIKAKSLAQDCSHTGLFWL